MPSYSETRARRVEVFRALHVPGNPFAVPNPWDVGSARVLEAQGASALATTSSGRALTLGLRDYSLARDEALEHCRALCAAVAVPVSADLENGFGTTPEQVAETVRRAADTGLAGGSIEDSTGDGDGKVLDESLAVERIQAAVEAARAVDGGFVLTARAEALLYGSADLDVVLGRLRAFAEAGADVVFAPGLGTLEAVTTVCEGVDCPVNVLVMPSLRALTLADFAAAGAARVSVGGALAFEAYATLARFGAMLSGAPFSQAALASAEALQLVRGALR